MSDQILWYATRGAGVVSILLFTAVTCLGILTAARWQTESWPRFLTAELHRNLALISVAFLAIHIVTAVIDPFTSLGLIAATIPFASSYRPLWVGLGVIALDLLLALVISSLLRARIGQRAWRATHWLAYAAWPVAVVHGIGSGTDSSAVWLRALDVLSIVAVVGALAWRVWAGGSRRRLLEQIVDSSAPTGSHQHRDTP
jgi:predicted ferric reductase